MKKMGWEKGEKEGKVRGDLSPILIVHLRG